MERRLVGIAQAGRAFVPGEREPDAALDRHAGLLGGLAFVLELLLAGLRSGEENTVEAAEVAVDALGAPDRVDAVDRSLLAHIIVARERLAALLDHGLE